MQSQLIDNYQRRFEYLRLSITDLCNFRCQYCLPSGYQTNENRNCYLSLTEITNLVMAFGQLGVKKVRLTGGEPTLRRDFDSILATIAQHPSIVDIALTTNGSRLVNRISQWQALGLTSLNVSVDSFSPKMFHVITGENKLEPILLGIDKAIEVGINNIKLNAVLMRGLNDDIYPALEWIKTRPVDLRFIELMETSQGKDYFSRFHLSGQVIENKLIAEGWQLLPPKALAGPAKVFKHADYAGKIGLIMPYSKDFCQTCNRLRVSAIGQLHYCLFGESAVNLRDLLQNRDDQQALKLRILTALKVKPESHFLQQHKTGLSQNLSYIGG
ncbi:GTP 3',8-cyclase MoaA [Orbaceae bacterium ac157xtp]